jgi:TatD DNase family protein
VKNDYLDTLKELSKDQRCVAIGEIGLDYFRNLSPKDTQKRVFIEQLGLAQSLDMPVIIHTRDATQDTLEILKKYNVKGVVHCFSDSAETAKVLLKMGYHIGFTGVVTFNNARKAIEAVNVVPMDRLLLETDCPYMAPVPNRGKRCTSDMISFTATKIAEIKGLSPQETVDITCENTCKLFKINL